MKNVVHIAAHMGGGVGKAISGILKKNPDFKNTLLLLETPNDKKYIDVCRANDVEIIVSDDEKIIRDIALGADVIVLDWWCHPLFLKVFSALTGLELRVVLWSHINGLYYPFLTFDFLNLFNLCMFTSSCTFENEKWSCEEKTAIKEKSSVIYGMGEFRPIENNAKTEYGIKDKFKIAYSGTLNFNKMNVCYPQICRQTIQEFPEASFEFFGRYDEKFSTLFEGCNVNFRGFITNLEDVLSEMDVYCYLLNEENFATTENALLEAMALGLPVIVMNNPAERSIITHNKNGFVADTPEQVMQYIRKLYSSENLRCELGTNARESVIKRYSFEDNLKNYYKLLNQALAGKPEKMNFDNLIDDGAWGFFRYFCGDKYRPDGFLTGESEIQLTEIFYESSKSSPKHFLKYYNDERLSRLVQLLERTGSTSVNEKGNT